MKVFDCFIALIALYIELINKCIISCLNLCLPECVEPIRYKYATNFLNELNQVENSYQFFLSIN